VAKPPQVPGAPKVAELPPAPKAPIPEPGAEGVPPAVVATEAETAVAASKMARVVGVARGALRVSVHMLITFVIQMAIEWALRKLVEKAIQERIQAAVEALQPQIDAMFAGKAQELLELESTTDAPVYATLTIALDYHVVAETVKAAIEHAPTPREGTLEMKAPQSWREFRGARLVSVAVAAGPQPNDTTSLSSNRDPASHELTEVTNEVVTIVHSAQLQRFSDEDLQAYLLEQAIPEALRTGDDAPASPRLQELQGRMNRLTDVMADKAQRKREAEQREREAEAARKQKKLDDARAAAGAPPPPSTPLLPGPGPAPREPVKPENDPLNIFGSHPRSLAQEAEDAADIAEAFKAEFVAKAEAIRRRGSLPDEVKGHQGEVEKWVAALKQARSFWAGKAGAPGTVVTRFGALDEWVETPEGRAALMRDPASQH
jgi:hypothetical protein